MSWLEASLYPKLLLAKETARYIRIKDNTQLRKTLKEIQQKFPDSLEAKCIFGMNNKLNYISVALRVFSEFLRVTKELHREPQIQSKNSSEKTISE
ncbi:MAG: hypothetical protein MZV64_65355 [Ignavibacteriales bacterium]|nr:hypothetical protein [Ignavibacteriales bacterium]